MTANERIDILIGIALQYSKIDDNLANTQAQQARKIAMRVRTRLPYQFRQLFCKVDNYYGIKRALLDADAASFQEKVRELD